MNIGEIINSIIEQLPVPQSIFEGTWALIGWMLAGSFGKSLDEDILEKVRNGNGLIKIIYPFLGRLLHFIHHFWIGMLGVVYFGTIPIAQSIGLPIAIPQLPNAELFWFCLGMALEDAQYHVRASFRDGYLFRMVRK